MNEEKKINYTENGRKVDKYKLNYLLCPCNVLEGIILFFLLSLFAFEGKAVYECCIVEWIVGRTEAEARTKFSVLILATKSVSFFRKNISKRMHSI